MLHLLKQGSKRLLRRFNRTLCYVSYPVTGCHFPDDLRLVVGKDDPLCLDVGAHWGETIGEFQNIFSRPVIHSFEPCRANFEVLQAKHAPPDVFTHQLALSDREGEQSFTLYEDSVLNSFLQTEKAGPQGSQRPIGEERVRMQTVDNFVKDNGIDRVDLLKVDTQGYEWKVLQGASQMLSNGRIQNLLLEINFSQMYVEQSSFTQILEFLNANGYGLIDFYHKARVGNRLSWCNALFMRL